MLSADTKVINNGELRKLRLAPFYSLVPKASCIEGWCLGCGIEKYCGTLEVGPKERSLGP